MTKKKKSKKTSSSSSSQSATSTAAAGAEPTDLQTAATSTGVDSATLTQNDLQMIEGWELNNSGRKIKNIADSPRPQANRSSKSALHSSRFVNELSAE